MQSNINQTLELPMAKCLHWMGLQLANNIKMEVLTMSEFKTGFYWIKDCEQFCYRNGDCFCEIPMQSIL